MRVSEKWQNANFGEEYPFNSLPHQILSIIRKTVDGKKLDFIKMAFQSVIFISLSFKGHSCEFCFLWQKEDLKVHLKPSWQGYCWIRKHRQEVHSL